MRIADHCIFDARTARPEVYSGIEFWRGWNGASDPVWSRDAEAVLRVCAKRFKRPVFLAVRIETYNPNTALPKVLHIRSEGHDPVTVRISRRGVQTVLLQTPEISPGEAYGFVTFSMDRPESPAQLGQSQDDRLLGVRIVDIREVPVPVALPLDLRAPETGNAVMAEGWDRIEQGVGVWSLNATPKIVLPDYLNLTEVPALEFDVETLPRPADQPPLIVEVWSGQRKLAVWDFAQKPRRTKICPLVQPLRGEGVEINFRINGLASPAMLGVNSDSRMLGLLIRSIDRAVRPITSADGA
jgi:hypothetical protein